MGEQRRKAAKEEESSDDDRSVEIRRSEKEKGGEGKRRHSRRSEKERSPEDRYRDRRRSEREIQRRDREREKRRDRERYKERERRKEKEREREREERDRERVKEKHREKRRDVGLEEERESEDLREHKRRRREEDSRENEEAVRRKKSEEPVAEEKKTTWEEDLEEEQKKLDEEMEKRRRRVQEWQELRRKQQEQEREKNGTVNGQQSPEAGKNWTLEGDSDDEEISPAVKTDDEAAVAEDSKNVDEVNTTTADEEEVDPLDAFMNNLQVPENTEKPHDLTIKVKKNSTGRIIQGDESDYDYNEAEKDDAAEEDENDDEFMKRVKKTKVEKLSLVDHSKINYPPFRKNFYIEVKEISRIAPADVISIRKELELKIHGKDVPKPVKTWNQTGLPSKILDMIKKLNFEKPMPIQAQALPVIMSGRDCIGIAKTGSGKTLAFVLPMLRHIKDQPPAVSGDGPIALIMAPTRELVQQIHSDIKKFAKGVNVNCVAVYGGSGVAQQISDLKRGTEIVVCTPGRMIDILCTSSGKITNLRRVTYLVMDEADRMFDMGFEPQITRMVQNTRPDRQTVLFSATFPRQVETLARKVLSKPVEIQVGGRSVVNKDITQLVEVRQESERFLRLLELLGEWYEKGKILVFVHSQDKCDSLFKDLLRHGYPCLSLHGAKDQTDRESTLSDFKSNVCNLLIATSIAARGLDVKDLELVVNFDVPNHYEDYVHRVGRTGRAGKKGIAVTFISEEEERYAPDLVKALVLSEQAVPQDLKALADVFMTKVNQGTEQAHGTGYGGSGFKFNEEEDEARRAAKKAQAREYGFEEDKSESESDSEGIQKAGGEMAQTAALAQAAAIAVASKTPPPSLNVQSDAAARAAALAAAMNLQHNLAKIQADAMPEHYVAEFEINDFPQNARWKVTHKETLGPISDWTGAAITTRGQFYPPGKIPPQGERKLYLFIEGPTESSVKKAKVEIKRVLEDCTAQALSLPSGSQPGKYSVL